MGTVTKVVAGTVVLGVGIGVAVRYVGLDPGCSPMPLLWPVPAGASRLALEVDSKGGAVVRREDAAKIIKALGSYDLVPVPNNLSPDHGVTGSFRLVAKGAATSGAPSAAMLLATAAAGGSDVLIHARVTSLLDGALKAPTSGVSGLGDADVLVVLEDHGLFLRDVSGVSRNQAQVEVNEQFALLIHGATPSLPSAPVPGMAKV
jgi:hypothetical protein